MRNIPIDDLYINLMVALTTEQEKSEHLPNENTP